MLQKNRLLSLLFISVLFVVVILLISSCKKTATTSNPNPSSPATQKDIAAVDAWAPVPVSCVMTMERMQY